MTNNLKILRLQKNMTQKQLADAIGVDVSVVSRYEKGEIAVSKERIEAISQVLDVDSNALSVEKKRSTDVIYQRQQYYKREYLKLIREAPYLERIVKLGANGHCELCKKEAPFKDKEGKPYLKMYVLDNEYNGNDPVKNCVALCSVCYDKMCVLGEHEDIEKLKEIASEHCY